MRIKRLDKLKEVDLRKIHMTIHKKCNNDCNEKNKEILKEYHKNYRIENKDEIRRKNRKYREDNKERLKEYSKKYYANNKEKWNTDKIIGNEWYKNNPQRAKKTRASYYQKHKKRLTEKHRNRYRNDIKFRLIERLRGRIRDAMYRCRDGVKKAKPTMEMLGCDINKLKQHIENQFVVGMTWDNYGSVWHIDHIIPIDSYDMSIEKEQLKCFHYSNLQPLLAFENLSKGCRVKDIDNKEISITYDDTKETLS